VAELLLESPEKFKLKVIGDLFQRYPQRRFVLVGDSGERDPEVYGRLTREFPAQVVHIFIRDVTSEPPDAPAIVPRSATSHETNGRCSNPPPKFATGVSDRLPTHSRPHGIARVGWFA
jgi:phosphatidate phosphatase APP1